MSDLLGPIMAYEAGELDDADTLKLFAGLVKSGMAWQLQGSYGRTAAAFIHDGYLSRHGAILKEV